MKKWENLPGDLRVDEVRKYYEILQKHKGGLFAKRVFDVVTAGILVVILSPVFACFKHFN